MTWAGCYSLDLYCDKQEKWPDGVHAFDELPHNYTDELGSVCRAKARKAGWIIRGDGSAICPKCSGRKVARTRLKDDFGRVDVASLLASPKRS